MQNEAPSTLKDLTQWEQNEKLKETIIQQLKECYYDNSKKISASIYELSGRTPTVDEIKKLFGNWTNAIMAAGIKPRRLRDIEGLQEKIQIGEKKIS